MPKLNINKTLQKADALLEAYYANKKNRSQQRSDKSFFGKLARTEGMVDVEKKLNTLKRRGFKVKVSNKTDTGMVDRSFATAEKQAPTQDDINAATVFAKSFKGSKPDGKKDVEDGYWSQTYIAPNPSHTDRELNIEVTYRNHRTSNYGNKMTHSLKIHVIDMHPSS